MPPKFEYNHELVKKPPLWRLERPKRIFPRMKTGNNELDSVFGGGIPYGLTIFSGAAGTGKSRLAQEITSLLSKTHKILYVYNESVIDALNFETDKPDNIFTANYIQFKPKWQVAIAELLFLLEHTGADVMVIDSLTTLFSETSKAVDEADIRGAIFDLKEKINTQIPVIAISQIRGSGAFTYSAGGQAVDHAADMLISFSKTSGKVAGNKYVKSFTEYIWSISIVKDKTGMAEQHSRWEVIYADDGLHLVRMEE